jgi:hypothetical protein
MPVDLSRLEALPAGVRERVESALAKTLETEIAATETGPVAGAAEKGFSRSKGLAFSRSQKQDLEADRIRTEVDRVILRNVEKLNDAEFARFADRLARLKGRA